MNESALSQSMAKTLVSYKNFPKEGVNFIDIFPLFTEPMIGAEVIKDLLSHVTGIVMVPESRGFLFVSALVMAGIPVVVLRKQNKLPGLPVDKVEVVYEKEYGFDTLYYRYSDLLDAALSYKALRSHSSKAFVPVTILDDVLATGGTAKAIEKSIMQDSFAFPIKVVQFIFPVEIDQLGGRALLEHIAPVYTIYKH